jgi:hypothetical protein
LAWCLVKHRDTFTFTFIKYITNLYHVHRVSKISEFCFL